LNISEKSPVTAMSMKMKVEMALYDNKFYKGRLSSLYLDKPFEFYSLIHMLSKMEEIFDEKKFPQAFLTPRSFVKKKSENADNLEEYSMLPENDEAVNEVYSGSALGDFTFEILVRFRQNASWQGEIKWCDRDLKQEFLSVLEMLKLIEEAFIEDTHEKSVSWY